jgi:ribosomal protein S12 methylthiotransferase
VFSPQAFAEGRVGTEVEVVVDREEVDDDGQHILIGRTRGEAPDVDPVVFLGQPQDGGVPPAQVGEIRRCRVSGAFLYELEAYPVA